ncbi:MAG: hypothetical protein H7Y04_10285 [Verrucomicrobia bacterium]|nr:hypothetical protein [Cytophagales bacterium]
MRELKFIMIILVSFLFFQCDKNTNLEAGIEGKVFGRVYDPANDIPVTNIKLKIAEYTSDFKWASGSYDVFVGYIDSVNTDSNGKYTLTFNTSGNGSKYKINLIEDRPLDTYLVEQEIITGSTNEVNFYPRNLYPVNVRVRLNNIDYLPVRVISQFGRFVLREIKENNVEIVTQVFVNKNIDNKISFTRSKFDGTMQVATFMMPATNTTSLTEFEIEINNSDFK